MLPDEGLTPRGWQTLLEHLRQEGSAALEHDDPYHASVWFAQSLYVVQHLPGYDVVLAALLFDFGVALSALNKHAQAVAFMEAAAHILLCQGCDDEDADMVVAAGSTIGLLEDFPVAQRLLKKAVRRYEALGLRDKSLLCQQELRKLVLLAGEDFATGSLGSEPHEFMVHVGNKVMAMFAVSPEGEVRWYAAEEAPQGAFEPPPILGRLNPWQVKCTNRGEP